MSIVAPRRSTALPITCSAAHDRRGLLGLLRWVSGGGKPHPLCPGPHLSLYIALCDRGPPTSGRFSVPDQDAVKGSDWPLGQLVEIKLTTAIYQFDMAVYTKIFLKFPKKFWPEGKGREFFLYASSRRGYYGVWQVQKASMMLLLAYTI